MDKYTHIILTIILLILPSVYADTASSSCSKGLIACENNQQCVQPASAQLGGVCSCDIECNSGYCEPTSSICFDILNVHVSSTDLTIEPETETTITLAISNNLNNDISGMSATLNIGSGAEITEVSSGTDCSANQCKYTGKVAGRGREEIMVKIIGNSEGTIPLSAIVTYTYLGKEHSIANQANVVIARPPEVAGFGSEKANTLFGNIIVIIFVIGLIYWAFKRISKS